MPDITELKSKKEDIKRSLQIIRDKRDALNEKIRDIESTLAHLNIEIAKLNIKIDISDHAIVRYVERVHGIDMKKMKNKIITKDLKKEVKKGGNGTYIVGDFKVVVRGGVIVTILT